MLTKLQIIELNEKDIRDTVLLFHGHPIEDRDDGAVNGAQIAALCADDWGLWRTITANLERCRGHVADYELPYRRPRAHREPLRRAAPADRGRAQEPRLAEAGEGRGEEALVRAAGGGRVAMRMFFATDIHGSEVCWKKFLNSGAHYKADVVVLGGDMTGKALVPIVDDGDGKLARDAARQPRGARRRGGGQGVRGGRHPPRLLPVPHRPRRAARARRTTNRAGTRCSKRRCSRRSSAGWRWPTSGSGAPASASSSAPATTTSSRSTRWWPTRRRSSSARAAWWTSATTRWRPAAGPTARRGTPTARRTRTSCSSGSSACSRT